MGYSVRKLSPSSSVVKDEHSDIVSPSPARMSKRQKKSTVAALDYGVDDDVFDYEASEVQVDKSHRKLRITASVQGFENKNATVLDGLARLSAVAMGMQ